MPHPPGPVSGVMYENRCVAGYHIVRVEVGDGEVVHGELTGELGHGRYRDQFPVIGVERVTDRKLFSVNP